MATSGPESVGRLTWADGIRFGSVGAMRLKLKDPINQRQLAGFWSPWISARELDALDDDRLHGTDGAAERSVP